MNRQKLKQTLNYRLDIFWVCYVLLLMLMFCVPYPEAVFPFIMYISEWAAVMLPAAYKETVHNLQINKWTYLHMFRCWLIMCFPLNHCVKALTVHSYLRMKRASRQSFSTTTTWGTKMCKCPFSLTDNSDLVMETCYSHTKQLIQVVPLLLCDVLHSVYTWWQQIQICGD